MPDMYLCVIYYKALSKIETDGFY